MEKVINRSIRIAAVAFFLFVFIMTVPASGAQAVRKLNRTVHNTGIKNTGAAQIAGRPDLVVTNITVNPSVPAKKDMITIRITVKNRGTAPTSAKCSLTMFLRSVNNAGSPVQGDHRYLIPSYTNNVPILAPGAKKEISKVFTTLFTGRKEVSGIINTESLEPGEESNLQNNTYKSYFKVTPDPAPADLILHKVGLTSDGKIRIKMSNRGKGIPDYHFNHAWVKVEVHGSSPHKQILLKDIDPNGRLKKANSSYVFFNWPDTGVNGVNLTSGYAYTVTVTLDCFPMIVDSNRDNNKKTVTLSP